MKKIIILKLLFFLINPFIFCQENGFYISNEYEYINPDNPSKSYKVNELNFLLINLNNVQGKFNGGELFWEWKNKKEEYVMYKWNIHSLEESGIENNNLFYKSYLSNMEVLGIESDRQELIIFTKNVQNNSNGVIIFNPTTKTSMIFHNIKRIDKYY